MTEVFVSYKAEDRRRVQPLVEALQAEGLSVWWDAQIGGGDEWRRSIEQQLDAAKCVVVVWSKRSTAPEGRFVRDEASRAMERGVYLPVRIDNVRLPLGFGETQALPLIGWRGDRSDPRYQAVLAGTATIIGGSARHGAALAHARGLDRRVVLGGALAGAAAVATGGWLLLKPGPAETPGSIAVLPFANLSSDPNQAYFSDGLAEELRSALARVGLQVIGRTSSEAVKNDDARTAAMKLGVANVLTGSVRRSPTTIRVSAQLITGDNGVERWSQEYDRSPGDALTIESDIARNVAQALSIALGSTARAALELGGTSSAAAQDLYFKALEQVRSDDSEASWRKALGLLNAAIAIDPGFANAHAKKSLAISELTTDYAKTGRDFDSGFSEAAAVAKQAIALTPNLAAAHVALATALEFQLHISAALAEHQRAHALSDSDVSDLLGYSFFLSRIGDTSAGLELSKQGQERDPLNPRAFEVEANALGIQRRYADSLAPLKKALAIAPGLVRSRLALGSALMHLGRYAEAEAEYAKTPADSIFRLTGEAILFALQNNRAASDQKLHRLQQVGGDSASWQYVEIYAQRGERQLALAALEHAWSIHDPGLSRMKVDAFVDPIRTEPQFIAIENKLNFPPV